MFDVSSLPVLTRILPLVTAETFVPCGCLY